MSFPPLVPAPFMPKKNSVSSGRKLMSTVWFNPLSSMVCVHHARVYGLLTSPWGNHMSYVPMYLAVRPITVFKTSIVFIISSLNRDPPDESQAGINVRVFPALLQDRREVLTATCTSGNPNAWSRV